MAYSQGGLITATDYNGFVGVSPSSTANTINTVWAVGNGRYGYGQTALSQVAVSNTITATQWSSLINTLNSIRTHQSGTGSGISSVTAGSTINYLSTLSTQIASGYTNALAYNTSGTTTTGATFSPNFTATNTPTAQTYTSVRTVTFASADQARYFFNAGGRINLVTISAVNNDASLRSADLVSLLSGNVGGFTNFGATTNSGRTATGSATVNTNNTTLGYYGLTTSNQNIISVTSTGYTYTGDYVTVAVKSNGVQGSNADKGTVITITTTVYAAGNDGLHLFNQTINVTWNYRIDIVYPETTNLSNTWGTVTVA